MAGRGLALLTCPLACIAHLPLPSRQTLAPLRTLAQPPLPSLRVLPCQALLGAAPVETTAALMGLCLRDPSDPGAWVANMADFTHLYTDR